MPSSGPVYKETTVPRIAGTGSLGGLGQVSSIGVNSSLRVFRKPRPQVALLLFAVIALAAGVSMLASGACNWLEAQEEQTACITPDDGGSSSGGDNNCADDFPLGLIIGGIFMLLLGFVAMGIYIKVADWRRSCVCPCEKKQSMARQMQCHHQNGGVCGGQGILALNPSTDPLVSHTQYAPVSELPRLEDEERRTLMPENKECLSSAEESDRMLEHEHDRRIVLRPMGHIEDA